MNVVKVIQRRTNVAIGQSRYRIVIRPALNIVTETGGTTNPRFVHTQSSASATWVVNHNLGFFPQVTVLSPGRIEVEATVEHVSANQVVITFNTAQTGQAIFS